MQDLFVAPLISVDFSLLVKTRPPQSRGTVQLKSLQARSYSTIAMRMVTTSRFKHSEGSALLVPLTDSDLDKLHTVPADQAGSLELSS